MSEEQPMPEEQEVIQYGEEVDQEIAGLRAVLGDLIDLLDATGGFGLEAGCGGDGPVVRLPADRHPAARFELRSLLVAKGGANLRSRIAHGVMAPGEFSGSPALYLWWLLLRVCVIGTPAHDAFQQFGACPPVGAGRRR
jgi:Domain of unknown function (DUF4209)